MFQSLRTGNLSPKLSNPSPIQSHPSEENAWYFPQNNPPARPARPRDGSFGFMQRARPGEQSHQQHSPPRQHSPAQSPMMYEEATTQPVPESEPEPEPERIKAPRIPSFHMLSQMDSPFFDMNPVSSGPQSSVLLSDHPSNRTVPISNASSVYDSPELNMKPYNQMDLPNSPHADAYDFASPTTSPQPDGNGGVLSYNSPNMGGPNAARRLRRKKDPIAFNILVAGTKNSGKTSFIEFILSSLAKPIKQRTNTPSPRAHKGGAQYNAFTPHYLETEIEGERVGITMYDSKGLERHVVDLQLREMTSFVESKFQETFAEEQKVLRSTATKDTHIHCVVLLLDPSRLDANTATAGSATDGSHGKGMNGKSRIIGSLDEDLDIDVLRLLNGKTTVVPIISKADTITTAHMAFLKRSVSDGIKKLGFDPYEGLTLDSDGESDDESVGHSTIREDVKEEPTFNSNDGASEVVDHTQIIETVDKASKAHPPGSIKSADYGEVRLSQISLVSELPYLPMSVISPDLYDPGTIGRRFPWGFADPYNVEHCDFVRLKENLFHEWCDDLRLASRERWYESWRTNRLRRTNTTIPPFPSNGLGFGSRMISNASSKVTDGSHGLGLSAVDDFQQRATSSGKDSATSGSEPRMSVEQKSMLSGIMA